jgi:hypothetical protein
MTAGADEIVPSFLQQGTHHIEADLCPLVWKDGIHPKLGDRLR